MFLLLVTLIVIDSTEFWRQSPNQSIFEKVRLKVKKVAKEHVDNLVRNFFKEEQRDGGRAKSKAEPRKVYVCFCLL